ncbi:MAG: FAD-dependent monooxygenase [Pseudomonadota bacterium]
MIGAGVAGLSAAIALAQIGANVSIQEQATAFEDVGAGLQLSPNAMRALTALGVTPRVTGLSQLSMYDGLSGAWLGQFRLSHKDMPYCVAHRADLIDALVVRAGVLSIPIEMGAEATPNPTVDLVVGADGVRSTVRDLISPATPRFTGKQAWRALIPANDLDASWVQNGLQVFLGPKAHLVTYPMRDDKVVNVVAITNAERGVEERWRQKGDGALMRAGFAGWSAPVWSLLEQIDEPLMWGLFDHATLKSWHDDRHVLVGDAAHPMVPFFAQGAAMALEDAVMLARCLRQGPQAKALERFQAMRKPRTSAVSRAAGANSRLFHFSHPFLRLGRRAVMPVASTLAPFVFSRRYNWVYGYDAKTAR